jgi:protein-ribulosamine 3-kinase
VPEFWQAFGTSMARLHSITRPEYGFSGDNFLGSTPQNNPWQSDGHAFYAEHRLLFQGRRAAGQRLLSADMLARLERMAQRLATLVPAQPASLLHGDLWAGNIVDGPEGLACLIDPAVYYGWAEADLAMTDLFGRLPGEFYDAYIGVRPLDPGYRERFEIYNLYHLLNHLNLFGVSYQRAVEAVLRRYG